MKRTIKLLKALTKRFPPDKGACHFVTLPKKRDRNADWSLELFLSFPNDKWEGVCLYKNDLKRPIADLIVEIANCLDFRRRP